MAKFSKYTTKSDLAKQARVSRPFLDKELKILLQDKEAAKVLSSYKKKLGFTPAQVDYITKHLSIFE